MNLFDYTQKKYWGGSWYPYWSLMFVTVLFGFFGLDHLWLRSPMSGFMKLIVNLFTFGLWYFYDLLQIFGESENVKKYGLSAPMVGPLGIGAGMFRGENGDDSTPSKSPIRYILYVILLCVPFTLGLEYVAAGDMGAAAFKFVMSLFFFITFPILIGYTVMNIIHGVVNPKSLFESGTYHMFPSSLMIGPRGTVAASVLGPHAAPDPDAVCSAGVGAVLAPVSEVFKTSIGSITAPATTAVGAVSAATTALATAVESTASVVSKTADTAGKLIESVGGIASGLSGVSGAITSGLQKTAMAQVPSPKITLPMRGGGAYEPTIGDWALIASMSGLALYAVYTKYKEWSKTKEEKRETTYNGIPIPNAAS